MGGLARIVGVGLLAFRAGLAANAGGLAMADEVYVAVDGNDRNPGTKERPFATLEHARDAIRDKKQAGQRKSGATVWLRGGTYERTKTFELGTEDSGTAAAPVVYRAVQGETVRISGGRRIPSAAFKPVADAGVLQRLDPAARGKVLQADLHQGCDDRR